MAYNVANNLRIAMPDAIGVDQLKRKNALADMQMQQEQQRNALYGQQIEQNNQRMQMAGQEAALEQIRQWAPGAIEQARAGRIAPFVIQGQRLGVIDPSRDPNTVTPDEVEEFATELGIGPKVAPEPITAQNIDGFRVLTQGGKPVPGGVQAPDRPQTTAPVRPNWTKVDQQMPDGTVQAGVIDMNAHDPTATFKPMGQPTKPAPSSMDQDRIYRGEDRMKNDFEQVTKDRREELSAARKVRQLATTGVAGRDGRLTPQAQQALIFMFGKVLDPASVLREGEYDRIAKARGYYDTAALLLDKVAAGDLLTKKQVQDIAAIAGFYEKAAEISVKGIASEYESTAKKRGYDPTAIISDPAYRSGSATGGSPAPGTRKSAASYLQEAQRGR